MTFDETVALLKVLAAYDGRNVGEADLLVWSRQMGDMQAADATEAVHQHYAETRERACPADIRGRAARIRNARMRRPEVFAPGCWEPDPVERRRLTASVERPALPEIAA